VLFGFVVGLSLGMMVTVITFVRMRVTCAICGRKHPPRPQNMTALEYINFFCRRTEYRPHLAWFSFFRRRRIEDDEEG
jgi:hypothetical protein